MLAGLDFDGAEFDGIVSAHDRAQVGPIGRVNGIGGFYSVADAGSGVEFERDVGFIDAVNGCLGRRKSCNVGLAGDVFGDVIHEGLA